MNRAVLVGRLTKDPELRYTQSGIAVANFTIAVNRRFAREGEQSADFIPVIVWQKAAENVAKYLSKGSQVAVEGRIQTSSYDNKDGQRVFRTEIVADQVEFIGSKGGSTGGSKDDDFTDSDGDSFKGDFSEEIPF
ncbi:MAG: single-stranded DNA-binding protein [Eubacteriales bacterium]|jgi:single-strand DNA-binding protein|nr:single-stranded DNA-binding protein [Eubacteriales bacterium]NCC81655.1 single-stranded DNA-binding protein [Clostridia bacterium]